MSSIIYALQYTGPCFRRCFNLGDDIQTLAVSRLLPRVDGYVSREELNEVRNDCVVPMNGYFLSSQNWPPSPTVRPVFFSFHIQPRSVSLICSPAGLAYLRKWQPIGCRDRGTLEILQANGVDAFYSRCLTLTLPRRERDPKNGKVFINGVKPHLKRIIPQSIRREAVVCDQAHVHLPITDARKKLQLAEALLDEFRAKARLVITSKIHCAMPCIAMGIPVVFLYSAWKKSEYRVQIMRELSGIHYVNDLAATLPISKTALAGKIDWEPAPLEIESLKEEIQNSFHAAFHRVAA